MKDYFRNLNSLDPTLNALVASKLKEIQKRTGGKPVSLNDLSDNDELEVLREYCLSLYREYRTLRTVFLEKMHSSSRLESLDERRN